MAGSKAGRRWHVNLNTGQVGMCAATKGGCPFKSVADGGIGLGHFDTRREAEAAYEGYAVAMAMADGSPVRVLSKKAASDTAESGHDGGQRAVDGAEPHSEHAHQPTGDAGSTDGQRAVIVDPSKRALYDEYRKMSPVVMQARARELSDEDKIALLTSPVIMSSRALHSKTPTKRDPRQWGDVARVLLSADLSKANDEQINAMTHHWDAAVRMMALKTGRVSAERLSEMAETEQYPAVLKAMRDAGARLPESAVRNMQRKLAPIGRGAPWWQIEAGWAEKGNVEERRYASARLCQDDGWVQNSYWDNSSARRSCVRDPDPIVRLNMARAGYKVKWDDVADPVLRREFEACDPETNSRLLA